MKLLDTYKSILEGYERLGTGAWGNVYQKDNIVYKVTEDEDEVVVSNAIMKSPIEFKHFPKIYSIKKMGVNEYGEERFRVARKGYTPLSRYPNMDEVIKLIKDNTRAIMAHIPNQKNPLPQEVIDNDMLMDTINGIIDEFSTLNLPDYKLLDFHLKNLGVDENGNIVLFDF